MLNYLFSFVKHGLYVLLSGAVAYLPIVTATVAQAIPQRVLNTLHGYGVDLNPALVGTAILTGLMTVVERIVRREKN